MSATASSSSACDPQTEASTGTTRSVSSTSPSTWTRGPRWTRRTREASRWGARVHFPPEQDRDLPDYYELFVFDPDGIRGEVGCVEPVAE